MILIPTFILLTAIQTRASPTYFVTVPNVIRYGIDTKVIVQVQGVEPVTVNIFLQDYPDRTRTFSEKQTGQIGNGLSESVTVLVQPTDLPESTDRIRYVYLTAKSSDPKFQFEESVKVLVTGEAGYIFIQTDKPIYNPRHQVKIRIIPVNEEMRPTSWPLQMDIVNPQGITVERKDMTWDGENFLSSVFTLPSIPVIGNWSVTAKFLNGMTTNSTVKFEVKEYDLPTFVVKISTANKYILPSDENFYVDIEAKYVYGKVVEGSVTYVVSILMDGHKKSMIGPEATELENGQLSLVIRSSWITAVNDNLGFPDGARLEVEAIVTERATGKRERAYDKSVVLVNTPYQISFTQSQDYFKPYMKYLLHIHVFLIGNTIPETLLTVSLKINWKQSGGTITKTEMREGSTNNDGVYTAEIDTGPNDSELEFEVRTLKDGLAAEQQAVIWLTIPAYYSPSESFLSVSMQPKLEVGDTLSASTMNRDSKHIERINFLVVSRGRIVHQASSTQNVGNVGLTTTIDVPVTPEMVPSARVIAYYIRDQAVNPEVVADSVWFDVEDTCDRANVNLESLEGNSMAPASLVRLKVSASPRTRVGFLAVDQAVYALNDRHTLKHGSIFQAMEGHDLGCGFGGGRDRNGVFNDAGLSVITNADLTTPARTSLSCDRGNRRRKRSAEDLLHQNHPCCSQGFDLGTMTLNITTCLEKRADVYESTESRHCARMFYQCCKKALIREEDASDDVDGTVRSDNNQVYQMTFGDIETDENQITIRQVFPESWMFEEVEIGNRGHTTHQATLPDSITTWVFQAVGVSTEHGLCVAQPENITTFKDFFISLDLPYSAVRLEQLEVRATIFNYKSYRLPVMVYMKGTEGICSSARPGENSPKTRVYVGANDAEMVKFPVVPLKAGSFAIDVIAVSAGASDWIRKELYVVNEGREVVKSASFWLDPQCVKTEEEFANGNIVETRCVAGENRQHGEVDITLPKEALVGTEKAQAKVIGNLMESTVTEIIEGKSLEGLLRKPYGCGEQTMIMTAPTVSVMKYLHQTNQITPDIERRGNEMISDGIQRELIYRKEDGSFSVWTHKPASTWLTAFVMKTFCLAKQFVHVDDKNAICSGIEWIVSQQDETGRLIESYWVHHKEMIGGVNGDASMTAYVLISLLECDCRPPGTEERIQWSINYLENELINMDRPLAVALTAYALALADSPKKLEANEKLKSLVRTNERGFRFWSHGDADDFAGQHRPYWYEKNPSALDVETTAYALLTQLEHNDIDYSSSIVEWLLKMRGAGGLFVSTQDTVVALQALSEYNIRTYAAEIDMRSIIRSSGSNDFTSTVQLSQEDATVQKLVDGIPIGRRLFVETVGSGLGRMEVEVRYNVNRTEEEQCSFDVDIEVHDIQPSIDDIKNNDLVCDVCMQCVPVANTNPIIQDYFNYWDDYPADFFNQDVQNNLVQNMPVLPEVRLDDGQPEGDGSRIGRVRRRKKRVAEAEEDTASNKQICITSNIRHRSNKVIDMAIVDIGLPTGYEANRDDLDKLEEEAKIDRYETTLRSVVLYLQTIPDDQHIFFKFKAKEMFKVSNRQAVQVHVYDYYNPSEKCIAFYSPTGGSADGDLDLMCKNRVCTCAETICMDCWSLKLGRLNLRTMKNHACTNSDYVISAKITRIDSEGKFKHYTTEVIHVHKQGTENLIRGDILHFWQADRCATRCDDIEVNHNYFIMGLDGIRSVDQDGNESYKYLWDDRTLLIEDYTLMGSASPVSKTRMKIILRKTKQYLRTIGCNL